MTILSSGRGVGESLEIACGGYVKVGVGRGLWEEEGGATHSVAD